MLPQDTEQSIPGRFSQQVARFPNSPAIKTTASSVSYRELDRLSNQLANAVLQQRLGHSNTVALLFEQGVESIVAILGVLKAGKIYISLDPSAKMAELRRIIEDCGADVLISTEKFRSLCQELQSDSLKIFTVESTCAFSSRLSAPISISPGSSAYIFYTSGSTGLPKGVVDSHRNVLHNVLRYTTGLQLDCHDRLSMIQACHFSGTVSSLFSALLNGGTVCPFNLAGEGIDSLALFLVENRITVFHSVPTIFESLMSTGRSFPDLRIVRLEGDRADARHIELFNSNFSGSCQLAIGLGATETGLTRQYIHAPNDPSPPRGSPLGYPVDGMEIVLVDESGEAVQAGEPGEILIRSGYLATGYWRQDELTAKAFVADPRNSSIRNYRTGDMGRMLPDHCLLYLGRKDFRVKINGICIETEQVESALESHPLIARALVLAVAPRRGVQQLVAYLVTRQPTALTVCEIRRYASGHLGSHMIPARYEFLEALPIDRFGKISRGSLPAIHSRRPPLIQPYEPASTERQVVLAECFKEILSLSQVGIKDNFYDLGGDSLMAMQLLLLVEERTGLTFSESEFYPSPDIATIDSCLVSKLSRASLTMLQPLGATAPLFCLHNQLGMVMHYRSLAERLAPDIPVLGVQAGTNSQPIAATSIESLAAEYLPLIQERQKTGPYFLCGNCFDGLLAFELAQLLIRRGEVVAFLGLIDTAFPIGNLQAAVRRVTQSNHPMRAFCRIFWRKFLHLFTAWSKPRTGIRGSDYDTQRVEATPSQRAGEDHLAELSNSRASKLMDQVGAKYRPKAYSGEITFFYCGTIDNRGGWHRVAKGGFSAVELPCKAEGQRPHLILPPFVTDLALAIKRILKAKSRNPESSAICTQSDQRD